MADFEDAIPLRRRGYLFGDVTCAAIELSRIWDRNPGKPSINAVFATVSVLEAQRCLTPPQPFQSLLRFREIIRVNQFQQSSLADLGFRPSQNLEPGRIRAFKKTVAVGDAKYFRAKLPRLAADMRPPEHLLFEIGVQPPQGFVSLTSFSFVPGDFHEAVRSAIFVGGQRTHGAVHKHTPAVFSQVPAFIICAARGRGGCKLENVGACSSIFWGKKNICG